MPHPRGEGALLDDVSFQIEQGTVAQIVGPTGVGKSVLFSIVSLRRASPTGRLVVAGRNLDRLDDSAVAMLRRNVGSCGQTPQLVEEESVAENLALPLVARDRRAGVFERVVESVAETPIEPLLEVPAGRLAHAERRLVGIWRALICEPDLVLIDGGLEDLGAFQEFVVEALSAAHRREATIVVFGRTLSGSLDGLCSASWRLDAGRLERLEEVGPMEASVEGAA
ncbi:MAG: ATP-binding cassette domain-containing protein [Persicimonas sp.]